MNRFQNLVQITHQEMDEAARGRSEAGQVERARRRDSILYYAAWAFLAIVASVVVVGLAYYLWCLRYYGF